MNDNQAKVIQTICIVLSAVAGIGFWLASTRLAVSIIPLVPGLQSVLLVSVFTGPTLAWLRDDKEAMAMWK